MNQLSDAEKQLLDDAGTLPFESSAMGKRCVMCPVRHGAPKLLPCCLCGNWCHVPCSYQTHLGRVGPCHVRILDPRTEIIVLSHPYVEDYVVLPTRPAIRSDDRNTEHDISFNVAQERYYTTEMVCGYVDQYTH